MYLFKPQHTTVVESQTSMTWHKVTSQTFLVVKEKLDLHIDMPRHVLHNDPSIGA